MMKSFVVLVALAVLTTSACSRVEVPPANRGASGEETEGAAAVVRDSGSAFDEKELVMILQQRTVGEMASSLNKVKKLGALPEGLALLERVWRDEKESLPELSWGILSDPQVRLNIVDLLEQAAQNGAIQRSPEDMHDYVLRVLASAPPNIAGQAAITLSIFEREDDVKILEKMALQRDGRTFRSIVIALSNMCPDSASSALQRIAQSSSGEDKIFVEETSRRMKEFKEQLCRK